MPSTSTLTVYQGNDEDITETISLDGALLDLTDWDVEFLIKNSAATDDDDVGNTVLSTATGEITKLDQVANKGKCVVSIPHSVLADPAQRYRRVDLVGADGRRHTVLYGSLTITDV